MTRLVGHTGITLYALVAVIGLATALPGRMAIVPAAAQQPDTQAIYKRLNDFYTAGNYTAALGLPH
ncbi:MAG: hypothetical protein WCR59_09960 [Planctomycetota bacterium]